MRACVSVRAVFFFVVIVTLLWRGARRPASGQAAAAVARLTCQAVPPAERRTCRLHTHTPVLHVHCMMVNGAVIRTYIYMNIK